MVGSLYVTLAVLSIYMFGSGVKSSILENVAEECDDNGCPWESIVLRFLFLIVVACHIPFVFFSGKEGVLIIIDEISRRSISKALEIKLAALGGNRELISAVSNSEINYDELEKVEVKSAQDQIYGVERNELSKSSPNVFKTTRK
jgi:hypothetical protein